MTIPGHCFGAALFLALCLLVFALALSSAAAMPFETAEVSVSVRGDAPVAETSEEGFICATLDWWPPEKCDFGTCTWHRASLLNLNLMNPIFQNAVKAFSPLKIRLGGSLQDQVVYHVGSSAGSCPPFAKNPSALFGFDGGCLPIWRWNELNQFFQTTGAQVAFGLNALYGRKHWHNSYWGPWNSSNARDLIQYTVNQGYQIQAWELGNELSGTGIGTSISAEQYAADIKELNNIIRDTYGDLPKPLVIAPDGFFDEKWLWDFLNNTDPNVVNVVTHHIYNLGPGVATNLVEKILDPSFLDREAITFGAIRDILRDRAPWASSWVGEAGGAFKSGHHLVSNAFVDGFWYLDQLGMAATFGTKSYCRQSLIGGNYGLLNTSTFHPNPDYYGALLWSRLMGQKVLAAKTAGLSYLRTYAHCLKKDSGVALLLLNLSNSTEAHVRVSIDPSPSAEKPSGSSECLGMGKEVVGGSGCHGLTRREFHLTAKEGNLHSQTVLLNGVPLEVTQLGEIPELVPKVVWNTHPIVISPLSIVFVTVPLQIATCQVI